MIVKPVEEFRETTSTIDERKSKVKCWEKIPKIIRSYMELLASVNDRNRINTHECCWEIELDEMIMEEI